MRSGAWAGLRERLFSSQRFWGAVLLLVVAILSRQSIFFFLTCLLAGAEGVSLYWNHRALDALVYRRALSQRRAMWGDTVTLTVEVENKKWLPLPWLRVDDEVPSAVVRDAGSVTFYKPHRSLLRTYLSVLWFQHVASSHCFVCLDRGEYVFGPSELRTGDLFGLEVTEKQVSASDSLLVYPKIVPLSSLGLPVTQPFGEIRTLQWLFDDPLRTVGVRDYAPGDSVRHIHWKATARIGAPQVRVFEPTRAMRVALFLDVAPAGWTSARPSSYIPRGSDALELSIVVAASLAVHLCRDGCDVSLYSNGTVRDREGPLSVTSGHGTETLEEMLEALALLPPMAAVTLDRVVASVGLSLPSASSAVIVSSQVTDDLIEAASRLRIGGRGVAIMYVGDRNPPRPIPGITSFHVGNERDWRYLPGLDFAA